MSDMLPRRTLVLVAMLSIGLVAGLLGWLALRTPNDVPARSNDRIVVPPQTSVIAVPITAPLEELRTSLEGAIPHTLWMIGQPGLVCVASKRIKVLFAKIRTPTITCRIVGTVTRGTLTLSGSGRTIQVAMPLHAVVSAEDIGGVLKRETATADARVHAVVTLDVAPDWSLRGAISIRYDWANAPHVDFLGRRIEFASKADARLTSVIAKLEQALPRELAKLPVRDRVAEAWRSAFTSLNLNEANPPVWMRITPRGLSYGGYEVNDHRLVLRLGMTALTETFIGPRPLDRLATPLPRVNRLTQKAGLVRFAIPVIADYRELEPVLLRALTKRSARPFEVPGLGPILARFRSVTAYGIVGGRIAVGVTFGAARPGGRTSHGTAWITALPVNRADSRRVTFTDLVVTGVVDATGSSLLFKLANAPVLADTIAGALTQNFEKDYDRLLVKVETALATKRVGRLILRAHLDQVRTGALQVTGQGIYLPVSGKGTAGITVDLPGR